MSRLAIFALAFTLVASTAQAADCGGELDSLAKAVSSHLTMPPEQKAAMLRMATSGYDHCMAGDTTHAGATRDRIMQQVKEHLGGR